MSSSTLTCNCWNHDQMSSSTLIWNYYVDQKSFSTSIWICWNSYLRSSTTLIWFCWNNDRRTSSTLIWNCRSDDQRFSSTLIWIFEMAIKVLLQLWSGIVLLIKGLLPLRFGFAGMTIKGHLLVWYRFVEMMIKWASSTLI